MRPKPHSGAVADRRLRGESRYDERFQRFRAALERPALPPAVAAVPDSRSQRTYGGISPVTLSRSNPRAKPRWFALLTILVLATGLLATSVLADIGNAIPDASFIEDDQGANDEPGQKDLTAQASAFHEGSFYSAWKWDDLSWSGKNTGDGCSLFTDDADDFVDYAVCATIGGKTPVLQTVTVYACGNTRLDRCTNPQLLGTFSGATAATYCLLTNGAPGQFGGTDTQIVCDISALSTAVNPDVPALAGSNLLNTCSYPSREPNSDPSDCVLEVPANTVVALDTESGGTIEWQATLTDEANTTPAAQGSVVFRLYSDSDCLTTALFESASIPLDAAGSASTSTTVIDSTNDPGSGTYYWQVTYIPAAGFDPDVSDCGEAVNIVATVTGSTGN